MPLYSRESLEILRQKLDLVDLLSSHIKLKRSGAYFKALCPFHEEKSPSFTVQAGDSHYHCFGCGAHGDGIAFLMNYVKMSFAEAVEYLAERYSIPLTAKAKEEDEAYRQKAALRQCMAAAARFYHFFLLYSQEGRKALEYLYARGLDLEFIYTFQVGLAPKQEGILTALMRDLNYAPSILNQVGLLGNNREFFLERIIFPILDSSGSVVGFSGRKLFQESFGPKYMNTKETILFKKSKVLFGLSHSRKRIAKEKRAIIVEGQIDALRLIQEGLNFTIAGQGTAFGEDHVQELLKLDVKEVFLALDGDTAGQQAAIKIGDLLQNEGVEVYVLKFPKDSDPDKVLQDEGIQGFVKYLDKAPDYLTFLVDYHAKNIDLSSPAKKNNVLEEITARIRRWQHPLIVHESLRKLAKLLEVPEEILPVSQGNETKKLTIQKNASLGNIYLDPDRILETDLLRWLFLKGGEVNLVNLIKKHLTAEDFKIANCRRLFEFFFSRYSDDNQSCDLLNLAINVEKAEDQLFLSDLLQKKVNLERAELGAKDTLKKILYRNWMDKREQIKRKINNKKHSDEEILALAKEFDSLAKTPPQVIDEQ